MDMSTIIAGVVAVSTFLLLLYQRHTILRLQEQARRQTLEIKLRERMIVENASDFICGCSKDLAITAASAACRRLWGYSTAEFAKRGFRGLITDAALDTTLAKLRNSIDTKHPVVFESALTAKDGSIHDVLWTAHYSETTQTIYSVLKDITSQKEIERMRQQLIAMVSHDLRAPLMSLRCLLSILSDDVYGKLNETGKQRLSEGRDTIDVLRGLFDKLLEMHRLETGKLEITKRPVPLKQLIEISVSTVKPLAEKRGVEVRIVAKNETILADEPQIAQVLVNLLSNAIKYSSPGEKVEIAAARMQDVVEVSIADKGRGIEPHYQKFLFEPFFQTPGSVEGSGLGLAICKRIIDAHNGEIGVSSKPNEGSRFWFRLTASDRR
jgi:PAS domain S-box-containing protein